MVGPLSFYQKSTKIDQNPNRIQTVVAVPAHFFFEKYTNLQHWLCFLRNLNSKNYAKKLSFFRWVSKKRSNYIPKNLSKNNWKNTEILTPKKVSFHFEWLTFFGELSRGEYYAILVGSDEFEFALNSTHFSENESKNHDSSIWQPWF